MGAKTMTFAPAIFMRYWTARSASLLQQAAARPRGVWGCAPDNRGGRFSGRRSAHLRKRKTGPKDPFFVEMGGVEPPSE